jgi:hypothetical protein
MAALLLSGLLELAPSDLPERLPPVPGLLLAPLLPDPLELPFDRSGLPLSGLLELALSPVPEPRLFGLPGLPLPDLPAPLPLPGLTELVLSDLLEPSLSGLSRAAPRLLYY